MVSAVAVVAALLVLMLVVGVAVAAVLIASCAVLATVLRSRIPQQLSTAPPVE
jgi:hypothetical protein